MEREKKTETASDRLARQCPPKGASPAEIKGWVAACLAVATPAERAEYDQTGRDLAEIFGRIGFDPVTREFARREFKVSV
ncbi:MAG: hypothetical protein WAZ94_02165 [Phycisphaerales bacterium]